MAKTEEPLTQLATRIPKELHRRLKLHCVTNDTSVMEFVVITCSDTTRSRCWRRNFPA